MRTLYSFATICVFGAAFAGLPACSSTDNTNGGGAGTPASAGTGGKAAGGGGAGGSSTGGAGVGGAGVGGVGGAGVGGSSAAGAPPGDAAKGSAVYTTQACNTCHAADGKGDLGPNITMSVTAGLGSWTYQQFLNAVRFGKDKDNVQLCVAMFQFSATDINDASMADLYAFLKSQPISDVVNKGSYCP